MFEKALNPNFNNPLTEQVGRLFLKIAVENCLRVAAYAVTGKNWLGARCEFSQMKNFND